MNNVNNHKIMVVEDQALVRNAISALLDLEDGFEVVAQCENGEHALQFLASDAALPDLILSDIEMPEMDGLCLAQEVKQAYASCAFVIMTTFAKTGYVKRALALSIKGFILKEASSEYLIKSLQEVLKGKRVIDPELALMALDDIDPLTAKEREALKLASQGVKTQGIAATLFLSEGTVRNYLSEAISKLDATNSVDAARIAKQKGWL